MEKGTGSEPNRPCNNQRPLMRGACPPFPKHAHPLLCVQSAKTGTGSAQDSPPPAENEPRPVPVPVLSWLARPGTSTSRRRAFTCTWAPMMTVMLAACLRSYDRRARMALPQDCQSPPRSVLLTLARFAARSSSADCSGTTTALPRSAAAQRAILPPIQTKGILRRAIATKRDSRYRVRLEAHRARRTRIRRAAAVGSHVDHSHLRSSAVERGAARHFGTGLWTCAPRLVDLRGAADKNS